LKETSIPGGTESKSSFFLALLAAAGTSDVVFSLGLAIGERDGVLGRSETV